MPWPIGNEPIDVAVYFSGSSRMPGLSPGSASPVRAPKPKARRYESKRCLPSSLPIMIVPTFEELATMSVTLHEAVACGSCSV